MIYCQDGYTMHSTWSSVMMLVRMFGHFCISIFQSLLYPRIEVLSLTECFELHTMIVICSYGRGDSSSAACNCIHQLEG